MLHPLFDHDLGLLRDIAGTIDKYLEAINKETSEVDDPDSFGYFDRAEHVTGLGFVACQTYIAASCGHVVVQKQKAFSFGPKLPGGQTVVNVFNYAANYGKHNSEWILDKSEKQKRNTQDAFAAIGFSVETDYPLSNILVVLTSPQAAKFETLIESLALWRNELSQS